MKYRVTINTDAYKPLRCSKKNWEPGTINSQMRRLNGWKSTERSLKEVYWRIELFLHGTVLNVDKKDESHYTKWLTAPKNHLEYIDEPVGIKRTMLPECPSWHQGYTNVGAKLDELKKNGVVIIPFSAAYDDRQYIKNMDGCYMQITAVP